MIINNITESLKNAIKDPLVGIPHSQVSKGLQLGYHVASIENMVSPHVHLEGDEIYHILEGEGANDHWVSKSKRKYCCQCFLGKTIYCEKK